MIGSTCFAVASIPGFANLVAASVVGAVYFVGSVFFTSAATGQLVQVDGTLPRAATRRTTVTIRARSLEWWGTVIQLVGTLWFNLNTFNALREGLDTRQQDLRIWTPDFLGSICFLVASWLAIRVVSAHPLRWHRGDIPWRIGALNLLGSVFFMVAALAAFVRPATDDLLDASLANSGTLLGAVCFFWGARLLLVPADSAAA
jgi:hypothetical protein